MEFMGFKAVAIFVNFFYLIFLQSTRVVDSLSTNLYKFGLLKKSIKIDKFQIEHLFCNRI